MKKISITAKEKRKEVILKLEKFGRTIYDQLEEGVFPNIVMPSRSIDNIYYDSELRQYVLGDKKVKRSASNIR
ncbi:MAG: DNA topoisomerase IV subunit A, partial [Candidatus Bathyarchaeota archaeon]|nr:DNA topoisomerase IV subunit A [Candidatus Bathyarchaeota archaeon]